MSDHYFVSQPSSEPRERQIRVVLAGKERTVTTAAGTFSPDRLDPGTTVLLNATPPPPSSGALLDIGCGWGPISLSLALRSPDSTVYATDVNERALDLTRRNARALGAANVIAALPGDIPADLQFASIFSNPPIHVGKQALHDLLLTWIPRLAPAGEAWLVVQKHLGSDSLARWLAEVLGEEFTVERTASKKAFRVIHIVRGGNAA